MMNESRPRTPPLFVRDLRAALDDANPDAAVIVHVGPQWILECVEGANAGLTILFSPIITAPDRTSNVFSLRPPGHS
jgi:hypothetical protein